MNVRKFTWRNNLLTSNFGVPSLETASRIDDSDKIEGLRAARYRYSARMREFEMQFEAKASELRAAYLFEVTEIQSDEAA